MCINNYIIDKIYKGNPCSQVIHVTLSETSAPDLNYFGPTPYEQTALAVICLKRLYVSAPKHKSSDSIGFRLDSKSQ